MFRTTLDPLETGTARYSDAMDMLLEKGAALVRQDRRNPPECSSHRDDVPDSAGIMLGMAMLEEDVDRAVAYLSGPDTIDLHPDRPDQVAGALAVFDNIVFLYCLLQSDREVGPTRLRPEIEELFFALCAGDDSGRKLPLHRLVPLNTWRLSRRQAIGEPYRPFFPWYDDWTLVPEDALARLCLHWHDIMEDRIPEMTGMSTPQVAALAGAVQRDRDLCRFVSAQVDLVRAAGEAVASSIPLRLAALAHVGSVDRFHLPDSVLQKGFQAVAREYLAARPKTQDDKIQRLFLAFLFGVDEMEPENHMALAGDIGAWLDAGPRTGSRLMREVLAWVARPSLGGQVVEMAWAEWKKGLEQAAERIVAPEAYMPGAIDEAVARLRDAEPASRLERLKEAARLLGEHLPAFSMPSTSRDMVSALFDACFADSYTRATAMAAAAEGDNRCLLILTRQGRPVKKRFLNLEKVRWSALAENRYRVTWKIAGMTVGHDMDVEIFCRAGRKKIRPLYVGFREQQFFADFKGLEEEQGQDCPFYVIATVEEDV